MSRPVFFLSSKPKKTPEHEKSMEDFYGCSGRAEESVSGGCDLRKRREGNLQKLIRETVWEALKSGSMERLPACEKEEIPDQMLDFLFQMEQE